MLKLLSFSTLVLSKFESKFIDPYFWLTHHIHKIFEARPKNNTRRDFCQLLIEVEDQTVVVESEVGKVEVDKHSFEKKMSFDVS